MQGTEIFLWILIALNWALLFAAGVYCAVTNSSSFKSSGYICAGVGAVLPMLELFPIILRVKEL